MSRRVWDDLVDQDSAVDIREAWILLFQLCYQTDTHMHTQSATDT